MKPYTIIIMFFFLFLTSCSQHEEKTLIAILTPVSHPSLEKIEQSFIETLKNNNPGKYCFKTYNAQGNKTLMRSEIDEILRTKPALIFTIGTLSSCMMAEIAERKEISTPIVFTCVNHPEKFLKSNTKLNITGVQELLNFKAQMEHLHYYRPNLQKVLLIFNPREVGLEQDSQEIKQILKEKNIELISVNVFQTNELIAKVPPFMQKVDAVIILKDNTVVTGLEILVKYCNESHVPLMTSDLDSPDRGAALGYGVYEKDFGIEAAQKVLQIINENVNPSSIPVTSVTHFELKINVQAAQKQGIEKEKL